MPVVSVTKELEFFYTDSGVPEASTYRTLILVHGHTFHSGAFQRLNPIASARKFRLICINRREYPGTTPFSPAELKIFQEGSEEERTQLLLKQGLDLGLLFAALIKECSLPQAGGVALLSWSLGNAFLISLISSINLLPAETKKILQTYVKEVILWDPPSHALGIKSPPGSYVPLWDEELEPEARGPTFGVWAASYFKHGDLSTKDFNQLEQRKTDPSKKPSTDNMTKEELFSLADFAAGDKCETVIVAPEFASVLAKQTERALFDPVIRESWKGATFWHIVGYANSWNIIYAAWNLEERVKAANVQLNFKVVPGANHFPMWDEPEKAFGDLQDCIKA